MAQQLILKHASASRPSGEWNDDDFDVLAEGAVVGRTAGRSSRGCRHSPLGTDARGRHRSIREELAAVVKKSPGRPGAFEKLTITRNPGIKVP
jgi:hypothetical protein